MNTSAGLAKKLAKAGIMPGAFTKMIPVAMTR
jgi:hypothetical protein